MSKRKTYNTTGMDIHHVVSIEMEHHTQSNGKTHVNTIMITDENGHNTEITIFSDSELEAELLER